MSQPQLPSYDKQVSYWRLSKDVLGTGSTSTVLRATHVQWPTLCAAVKIISRSALLAKSNATSLHLVDTVIDGEIRLMKLAQHERVVRLYDVFHRRDFVYIVMEHAPNKTLYDLFRASPGYLPGFLVTRVFSQLIQGLAYLHDAHIVHRDLKLENIYIFGPDVKELLLNDMTDPAALNIKIGDFGLAHLEDPNRLSKVFHGSPHYQAPEVWLRIPHRPLPTDVWSAGIILYALLCRRLPFDLETLRKSQFLLEDTEYIVNVQGHNQRSNVKRLRTWAWRGRLQYMVYDTPATIHPVANNLLRKIFAYDPTLRPTAQSMLRDNFFHSSQEPSETRTPGKPAIDPHAKWYNALYIQMGRRVPRARKLSSHETGKDILDGGEVIQSTGERPKDQGTTLRHKVSFALPRMQSSVPLSSGRLASEVYPEPLHHNTRREGGWKDILHPDQHPPSIVANNLQERREALLRRAYELGFSTVDLRDFEDEARMIVQVAREAERRSMYNLGVTGRNSILGDILTTEASAGFHTLLSR